MLNPKTTQMRVFALILSLMCFLLIERAAAQSGFASISPQVLQVGLNTITITGRGTQWEPRRVKISAGAGVQITDVFIQDAETILATVNVNTGGQSTLPFRVENMVNGSVLYTNSVTIDPVEADIILTLNPLSSLSFTDLDPAPRPHASEIFTVALSRGNLAGKRVIATISAESNLLDDNTIWQGNLLVPPGKTVISNRDFKLVRHGTARVPEAADAQLTGYFPAGRYDVNVRVFDNGNEIGTSTASLYLTDNRNAPDLLYPKQALRSDPEIINDKLPLFLWQGQSSEYEIRVFEIPDAESSNQDIMFSRPLLAIRGIYQTHLQWPAAGPMLLPGRLYGWQVIGHSRGAKDVVSDIERFRIREFLPDSLGTTYSGLELKIGPGSDSITYSVQTRNWQGYDRYDKQINLTIVPHNNYLFRKNKIVRSGYYQNEPSAIIAKSGDELISAILNPDENYGDSAERTAVRENVSKYGWALAYPQKGRRIAPAAFVMVVELGKETALNKGALKILLDDVLLTENVIVSANRLYIVIGDTLKRGRHVLEIRGQPKDASFLPAINSHFYIDEEIALIPSMKDTALRNSVVITPTQTNRFIEIRGAGYHVAGNSDSTLGLRSAHPYVGQLYYRDRLTLAPNLRLHIKAIFNSDQFTDHTEGVSRNYIGLGLQFPRWTAKIGDQTLNWDPLVANGLRITGAGISRNFKKGSFEIVTGISRREYIRLITPAETPSFIEQPSRINHYADNYSLTAARRFVTAARLNLGRLNENSLLSISLLRSRDLNDRNVNYPLQDNFVVGIEHQYRSNLDNFYAKGGISFALTTLDRSYGKGNASILDSVGYNPIFKQAILNDIVNFNQSSLKLGKGLISLYFQVAYKVGIHNLEAQYKVIGGAYYSHGNTNLRNDQETFVFRDHLLWKSNMWYGLVQYQYSHNNTLKNLLATNYWHNAVGQLIKREAAQAPGLRFQLLGSLRVSERNLSNRTSQNDKLLSVRAAVYKNFNFPNTKLYSEVRLTRVYRHDDILGFNSVSLWQTGAAAGLHLTPAELRAEVDYAPLSTGDIATKGNRLAFSMSAYSNTFRHFRIGLGYRRLAIEDFFSGSRDNVYLTADRAFSASHLSLEAGIAPYATGESGAGNFKELYTKITYRLNLK